MNVQSAIQAIQSHGAFAAATADGLLVIARANRGHDGDSIIEESTVLDVTGDFVSTVTLLSTLAALPRSWRVSTLYDDGSTREHDAHSQSAAESFATMQRRKIGRSLINRDTGKAARVIHVDVAKIERD